MPAGQTLIEYGFRNPQARVELEVLALDRLRDRLSPEARAALHRADFHQLFAVTSGEVDMVVDFTPMTGRRGTVLHARPGQVVRLPSARPPGADALAVLFTPVYPQRLPELEQILSPFGPPLYEVAATEVDALLAATTELAGTYASALSGPAMSPGYGALLNQMLGVVLLRLAMSSSERQDGPNDTAAAETVHRFRMEVERSFAATRSASDYAHRLGYSARTLNRACLAVTSHSAKEVIDARVILEAKRMLAHTGVPASIIARRLGFSEASNFVKFFARGAGVTPGAFRLNASEATYGAAATQ